MKIHGQQMGMRFDHKVRQAVMLRLLPFVEGGGAGSAKGVLLAQRSLTAAAVG